MSENNRLFLEKQIKDKGTGPRSLVPLLLSIQDQFGYLPIEILNMIPEMTQITPFAIKGVMTFYPHFRLRPGGKHTINVCIGTACYVKGAERTFQAFREYLKIKENDDTDPDRLFTIGKVACLGCCMLAPAVQIDDLIFGRVTADEIGRVISEFNKISQEKNQVPIIPVSEKFLGEVKICLCSSCAASGAIKVYNELILISGKYGCPIKTTQTGCTGISFQAPILKITDPQGKMFYYGQVNSENLHSILLHHFSPGSFDSVIESLLYMDEEPAAMQRIDHNNPDSDVWLTKDHRISTEGCMEQTPCDLKAYLASGGFNALSAARKVGSDQIISEITDSGLRGRGGAGFPTGKKWRTTASIPGKEKYVICNADEGDPGAFMDRMLLESVPFRVIEGMIIAGLAIGAKKGFIFVRREYPLAVKRIREAISICEQEGLFSQEGTLFSLEIVESAGAFVCGEETALIAAIEGGRGIPSERPPYPSEKGLFQAPTLINNVETFATIPWILVHGAQEFKKYGTTNSPGTKTFALAGKIKRGGLIEVPMGITIRKVLEEIGGGVSGNARLKAVQIGGPSGGCLPERLFDLPIDFEALSESGAIMGSGGLVALDEHDCMVDIARYFLEFTADESCGNCSFCRIGAQKMLGILKRLCNRESGKDDLNKLEELSRLVKQGSRCGLGKTAPNPVITTMKYFRDEYDSHLDGFCPAGKCPKMFNFSVKDSCNGCMLCARACPANAILFQPWSPAQIDQNKCVRCGVCRQTCPEHAIEVVRTNLKA
ncbi:MAG: NAD(P)H-dependent oxidoreductase subunit E [Candidatus Riflebacteria bacterium]|nr:NAD(P)H-dependent oxidoreductase subunit E [Candidatus Riflebacteria bacterium]